MFLIQLFFLSIGSGILSSTPPGPINLLIADQVLNKKFNHPKSFLAGIIFADAFYAFLAFWGYDMFFQNVKIGPIVTIIGGTFLAFIGISSMLKVFKEQDEPPVKESKTTSSNVGAFIYGLALCGTNPIFLVFWAYMASVFADFGLGELSVFKTLLILAGIAVGDLLWFITYIQLLKKGVGKLNTKVLRVARFVIAAALIGLGGFTIVKALIN